MRGGEGRVVWMISRDEMGWDGIEWWEGMRKRRRKRRGSKNSNYR